MPPRRPPARETAPGRGPTGGGYLIRSATWQRFSLLAHATIFPLAPDEDMESAPTNRTVMIIEDDPEVRGIVKALLSNEGFQVEEAADGRIALERVFLVKPDLIL